MTASIKRCPFSDGKIFTIEESFNKQNVRVYEWSSKEASKVVPRVQQTRHPVSAMVWWDVSYDGPQHPFLRKQWENISNGVPSKYFGNHH